jgi:hypothetical protein
MIDASQLMSSRLSEKATSNQSELLFAVPGTGLILDWGKTRPTVELRRRRRRARARSSRYRDSADSITATWSPPKIVAGRESPSRSNLRRSPGGNRIANLIPTSPIAGRNFPRLRPDMN